jgi:hypothetical protein
MKQNTYESRNPHKPVFGAIAVAAAMATLGLAVVGPVTLSTSAAVEAVAVAPRTSARPIEVAILPATIQVVGKRTKTAHAQSPFLPASFNVR